MALADTAKLIASLELVDKFSPTAKRVAGSLGTLEKRFDKLGATAQRGLGKAAHNVALMGAAAAGFIGANVVAGIQSLAELESASTSVQGAIEQVGQAGQISAEQVATWANDIERDIGAAFDDKAILGASATLIRFGKTTPGNLRQAMEVMTDLAVRTGDVDSAATLLGKALADPTKAAGKLARQGIVLTKAEQDTIKAMVEANDVAGAQAFILDELEKTTKGAAAASQGPLKRSMSVLRDVIEDTQRALAEGFLPVLERVAEWLSRELAKPATIASIRSLGQGLANAFDQALSIATKIPWDSVANAMKLAGQGAKAALDFFTALPPWVQTAVLTGWGLNKLTGGALGDIVGELGKGLIKGVLGMNAGVVNINAAVVNGPGGGIPGAGGKVPSKPSIPLAPIGGAALIASLPLVVAGDTVSGSDVDTKLANLVHAYNAEKSILESQEAYDRKRGAILEQIRELTGTNGKRTEQVGQQIGTAAADALRSASEQRSALDRVGEKVGAVKSSSDLVYDAVERTRAAFNAKDLSVDVSIPVSVSSYVTVRGITNAMRISRHIQYNTPGPVFD